MNTNLIHHFIHLYFLTEFEVLFYIFYIMPYEKNLIMALFDVSKVSQTISYDDKYNTDYNDEKCMQYQTRLDDKNKTLWNICIYYIIGINVMFSLIFFHDLWIKYNQFVEIPPPPSPRYNSKSALVAFGSTSNLSLSDYKKNDDQGIEMHPLSLKNHIAPIHEEPKEPVFIIYYWKTSIFVAEFCKTVQFIVLVGIFEYLFFISIINKYKIMNTNTLICHLVKQLKPN